MRKELTNTTTRQFAGGNRVGPIVRWQKGRTLAAQRSHAAITEAHQAAGRRPQPAKRKAETLESI